MIPVRFYMVVCVDAESAIKTRFKALFKKWPSGIRCYRVYNFTILSAQMAPAGRPSVIPKPMTLGPKFYTKLVSSITRRRKQVQRSYRCESSRILNSWRFAPVAPLDLLSASSYGRNKFRIEFWSQCHIFRFRKNRKSSGRGLLGG